MDPRSKGFLSQDKCLDPYQRSKVVVATPVTITVEEVVQRHHGVPKKGHVDGVFRLLEERSRGGKVLIALCSLSTGLRGDI